MLHHGGVWTCAALTCPCCPGVCFAEYGQFLLEENEALKHAASESQTYSSVSASGSLDGRGSEDLVHKCRYKTACGGVLG